ncbi:MAG: APC family permease [Fimbriimonadaceae bacterium]|nr:APC family permease [Fimbriimonadaceae bacterium]
MPLGDLLLGRRLKSTEDSEQKLGVSTGFPLLGIDALSSTAYGTEAALLILMHAGVAGFSYLMGVTWVIIGLMMIVLLSYRQTIKAYPTGGGSYTVATENLGRRAGLVAASALLLDYVLVVAIGASAGVAVIVTVFPSTMPYVVPMSLGLIALMTIVNLRGVKESGMAFAIPVYGYITCLLGIIAYGVFRSITEGPNFRPLTEIPDIPVAFEAIWWMLLLRAFSNGCAALTGIEAIANGVELFQQPPVRSAQRVLMLVVVVLSLSYLGLSYLAVQLHIPALTAESGQYKLLIAQIIAAVVGEGGLYFVFVGFLMALMALSANTSFAGFPNLCRLLARDDYMPHAFNARGRRLVYSAGIWTLTILSSALTIALGGLLENLLPLYAVGVFLAFTLSQIGMVRHWRNSDDPKRKSYLLINATGATMTGVATLVIMVTKFQAGAWMALILMPAFVILFFAIKRHYIQVNRATSVHHEMDVTLIQRPIVIVPVQRWNSLTERAMRFAINLSDDVQAIHVADGEGDEAISYLRRDWKEFVEDPLRSVKRKAPELIIIPSPYRRIITPILEYVKARRIQHPGRQIMVVVPELVEARWYQYFLHNQRAQALKAALLIQGENDIVVMNVPWYLDQHMPKKEKAISRRK